MYGNGAYWRGLVFGILVGVALGLLLAPRRGEETKAAIRAHLGNAWREAAYARVAATKEVLDRYAAIVEPPPAPASEPAEK